jgi:hypothetical protein
MTNITQIQKAAAFTVYELVNDRLREIYVGRTSGPVFRVLRALRFRREPAIAHWDLDDALPLRSIEFGLNERDAARFIEHYAKTPLPDGWRYLT